MVRKDVTYKPVASFFFKWGRGRQTHPKNLNVLNKNIKKKNKKGYFSNSQNHEKYNPGDGGGGGNVVYLYTYNFNFTAHFRIFTSIFK